MFSNEIIASFNELEFSIYNYISRNMEKVVYMRIRELAAETHVSTATILRFCRKVNCEGFSEFKARLKIYIEDKQTQKVKSSSYALTEFFERTLKGDLEDKINQAAQLLAQQDVTIIFIGNGSSGIMAEYGARYFSGLGAYAIAVKDPFFQFPANQWKSIVTIALSVTGENYFTLSHINQLKQEGSKIISVTNNRSSTAAKLADITIPYYVTEEIYEHTNITTQVPVVYIVEALARQVQSLRVK